MAGPPARWLVKWADRRSGEEIKVGHDTPHRSRTRGFSVTTTQCTRSRDMRAATARSDVSGVQWISPQCIESATLGLHLLRPTVIGAVSDTT